MIIFSEEAPSMLRSMQEWKKQFLGLATVELIDTSRNAYTLDTRYGYKYMCKFFTVDLYTYLHKYDYYFRCDTDCFLRKVSQNIFTWVVKNDVQYGWAAR